MERLTMITNDGIIMPVNELMHDKEYEKCDLEAKAAHSISELSERLFAYEELGINPEKVIIREEKYVDSHEPTKFIVKQKNEDLELTPDQVREMSALYQQKCEEVARLEKRLENSIELPCKVGDTVYIIAKCKDFPLKLDGTMYDSCGGYGTATGYYCPYEDSNLCPFINCEDPDCDSHENELGIFEDMVCHICIEEDKMWFVCENSNGWELNDFKSRIFLSREEAEKALKQ